MYDSTEDTWDHIIKVRENLENVMTDLRFRSFLHDESKLLLPEKETFDRVTPALATLTYGSDEYKQQLSEMQDALRHHYHNNNHHPEFYAFTEDGFVDPDLLKSGEAISRMNLAALVEMLCDWKAASERHNNGDIHASIDINAERFGLSPQLVRILHNTVEEIL